MRSTPLSTEAHFLPTPLLPLVMSAANLLSARQGVNAFYQQHFGHSHTPVLYVPGFNPFDFIGLRGEIESTKTLDELAQVLGTVSEPVRNMAASVVATELHRLTA